MKRFAAILLISWPLAVFFVAFVIKHGLEETIGALIGLLILLAAIGSIAVGLAVLTEDKKP